jgi:DNA gyrase subunit B
MTGDAPVVDDSRTGKKRPITGTEVTFLASKKTFTKTEYDLATLEHRLRELRSSASTTTSSHQRTTRH